LHPQVGPAVPPHSPRVEKGISLTTETIWRDLSAVTGLLDRLYVALHHCEEEGGNRGRLEQEIQEVILRRAVLIERLGADTGEAA
jgi:hypothetical protein